MTLTPDLSGEPNFFPYLTGLPAVAALFGVRVYHQRAPAGMRDMYLVWQSPGVQRQDLFCGPSAEVGRDYQFDIYSRDPTLFLNGQRAIQQALLQNPVPIDLGGVRALKILAQNDFDSVDPEPGLMRRTQLYRVWYSEG